MEEAIIKKSLWTIIILANCENNSFLYIEEIYNDISQNVLDNHNKIIQDVNFIMLVDTPYVTVDDNIEDKSYKFFETDGTGFISIYRVEGNSNYRNAVPFYQLKDTPEDNLSNQLNFEKHLDKIKSSYPADRYGFIYKSHGGNTTDISSKHIKSLLLKCTNSEVDSINDFIEKNNSRGLPKKVKEKWDVKFNPSNWELQTLEIVGTDNDQSNICLLTLIEKNVEYVCYDSIRDALINIFGEYGIEFILMDCCWGMRYELLNIFYTTSKYYIGSADESPLRGIGYDIWSKELLSFPNMRSNELANMLVAQFFIKRFDDYYDHSNIKGNGANQFFKYGVSITAVDMAQFNQTAVNLSAFSKELLYLMEQESVSETVFNAIKNARKKCADFTYVSEESNAFPMYNIDCLWFVENVINQFELLPKIDSNNLIAMANKLIIQIKLKLIIGFLSNNYTYADVTSDEVNNGGYGITLRFAKQWESEKYLSKQPGYLQFIKYENAEWDKVVEKYHSLKHNY